VDNGAAEISHSIEENSDVAVFPNVNTETKVAGIPLKLPILNRALETF